MFCAQSFTQNENVVTVGANRVSFLMPVTMEDFLTLSASVTRVRCVSCRRSLSCSLSGNSIDTSMHVCSGARMEVAVDVFLKSVRSTEVKKCHTGYALSAMTRRTDGGLC